MSESGLVSRVSPVQTALRNCTKDEGRPFEVGNQVLIATCERLGVKFPGPTRQLYPSHPTFVVRAGTSRWCQLLTHALQQNRVLFDRLIGKLRKMLS